MRLASTSYFILLFALTMVFYSRIIASFHTVRSSRVFLPRKCLVSTTVGECANSAEERKQLFSVAPMMEYTDRHQRYFQRLMSKHTVLYTEMVTSQAITRTDDPDYLLRANIPFEEPLVFQLGGADPVIMGRAAKAIKDYGYSEININCGCPSEKVAGAGAFGASLMLNPKLVADIASSIHGETGLPTTVKCRIGVDGQESYENLTNFINTVSTSGIVKHFIIHARIAVLGKKFSADDNRKIPPLKYDVVYQLVKDFPHLRFTLNGGVQSVEEAEKHIHQHGVHGVMVGRAVVSNPYHWGQVDSRLFGQRDPGM